MITRSSLPGYCRNLACQAQRAIFKVGVACFTGKGSAHQFSDSGVFFHQAVTDPVFY